MKIVIGIVCVIVVYFCYTLFYALVRRNDLAETLEQKMKEDERRREDEMEKKNASQRKQEVLLLPKYCSLPYTSQKPL